MPDARIRYPTPRMAQIRQREFVQRDEDSGAMIRRSRMKATARLLLVVTNLILLEAYRRGGYQFGRCLQWCEFW